MTGQTPSDYYLDVGPRFLREAYNDLVDLCFEIQPLAGPGLARNDSKMGRSLSVTAVGGKGGALITAPFEIISSDDDLATVNPYSYIFKAALDGTTHTIIGLTDSYTPVIGDYAYIEISQDNTRTITAVEFLVDTGWDNLPQFYTVDDSDPLNPFVDSWFLPIARFVDPTDATPGKLINIGATDPVTIKVIPLCNQNQLLVLRVASAVAAWSPEAWTGIA